MMRNYLTEEKAKEGAQVFDEIRRTLSIVAMTAL